MPDIKALRKNELEKRALLRKLRELDKESDKLLNEYLREGKEIPGGRSFMDFSRERTERRLNGIPEAKREMRKAARTRRNSVSGAGLSNIAQDLRLGEFNPLPLLFGGMERFHGTPEERLELNIHINNVEKKDESDKKRRVKPKTRRGLIGLLRGEMQQSGKHPDETLESQLLRN